MMPSRYVPPSPTVAYRVITSDFLVIISRPSPDFLQFCGKCGTHLLGMAYNSEGEMMYNVST